MTGVQTCALPISLNRVPLVLVNAPPVVAGLDDGELADIAPTLLSLLQLPQAPAMTGHSLLKPAPVMEGPKPERRVSA